MRPILDLIRSYRPITRNTAWQSSYARDGGLSVLSAIVLERIISLLITTNWVTRGQGSNKLHHLLPSNTIRPQNLTRQKVVMMSSMRMCVMTRDGINVTFRKYFTSDLILILLHQDVLMEES